jgi:hypothetical protein
MRPVARRRYRVPPWAAARSANGLRATCRALPLGTLAESIRAILALSATHPAEPSEMATSDSLMGLAGLSRGPRRFDLFVTLDR